MPFLVALGQSAVSSEPCTVRESTTQGVDLVGAKLDGADLSDAVLAHADLRKASFVVCRFIVTTREMCAISVLGV